MNGYELADYVENTDCEYINYKNVANTLREQAKYIAILEAKLNHYGPLKDEVDTITTSRKELLDCIEYLRKQIK